MPVDTTWVSPTSATLDLAAGALVGETTMDAIASNFKHRGGTTGTVSACVYHNAAQSVASGAFTTLAFNSERSDPEAFHDPATNNSRVTVPAGHGGTYLLTANVDIASGAGSLRLIRFLLNGVTEIAVDNKAPVGGGNTTRMTLSRTYPLAAGDYVEVQVYQDSGGALNVSASGNYSPEFAIAKV